MRWNFTKKIRKAVRTFLIKDNKVVVIKYTTEINKGFYDIPGGKIEDGETSLEAAIREFKEETNLEIHNPKYAGNLLVEYPDLIYDLDIYLAKEYSGKLMDTKECQVSFQDFNELFKKDKLLAVIYLLDKDYNYELFNLTNFKWHFIVDANHHKIFFQKN